VGWIEVIGMMMGVMKMDESVATMRGEPYALAVV